MYPARQGERKAESVFLDHFVSPAFDQFDAVHRSYATTFGVFRKVLSETPDFDDACNTIAWTAREQILDQADFRTKLYHITVPVTNTSTGRADLVAESLENFVGGIREYLVVNSFNLDHPGAMYNNQRWTSHVVARLRNLREDPDLDDDDRSYVAIASLDAAVAEMQFMYSQVCGAYYTLKGQLVR